jgi:hypothetical protein
MAEGSYILSKKLELKGFYIGFQEARDFGFPKGNWLEL